MLLRLVRAVRGGWWATAGWVVLIVVAFGWGWLLRRSGRSSEDALPPLHASGRLLTWQLLPAVAYAVVMVGLLPMLARRLEWRWLLPVSWLAAVGWAVVLAVSDGVSGLTGPLTSRGEYLSGLSAVSDDPLRWLRTFTEQATHYPTHVAGHPPGPTMLLWALDAVGLRGPGWAAALLIGAGGSAVVAIAITVGALAGRETVRRLLPFLVLAPLAVWIATTMDALFLAVGAWGVALLALAAKRTAVAWGLAAGVLLGALPYLSYGLLPLYAIPLAVLIVTRPGWKVVASVVAGMVVVPLVFTALGFWWPDGVAVTQRAYAMTGGSNRRSYLYFLVGNLAVLGLLVGPAVAYALGAAGRAGLRRAGLLVAAALAGVAVLDLSSVTRGEVERIWLPYAAWIIVAAMAYEPPARRWLAAQAAVAIVVQALVLSPW